MSLITKIPEGLNHGWTIDVIPSIHLGRTLKFTASHPNFGTLSFGLRPEGGNAVGWDWTEVGGGGSGVIPYAVLYGKLYIGLIAQNRPTMSDNQVWQIPRGFLNPNLTHLENAAAELTDEVGIVNATTRLVELRGEPQNPNSTYFVTRDGGFRFYGFQVAPEELDDKKKGNIAFKPGVFKPSSKMGEKITSCEFFHWEFAAQIADGFTNSGVARLLATYRDLVAYL